MITEIPTPAEFQATGLNQLHLAWQIAIKAVDTFEEAANYLDESDHSEVSATYWSKSQPALANAFGLIQQAMELALKGRIAAVSPYLLITRDPKDWPKGVETTEVPFSEFRTLDAADLVKVHNTFSPMPLGESFRQFWESVRRDRNKVMHSVSARSFEPADLIRAVLTAAQALFGDVSWPRRLFELQENGTEAALGLSDYTYNTVLGQVDVAMRHLSPAEKRDLLGHQTGRHEYLCPPCYDAANHDYQDQWPHLAQLVSRKRGETIIRCIVCEERTEVERQPCTLSHCEGDVIHDGKCLTCHGDQHDPANFQSDFADPSLGFEHRYHFDFRGSYGRGSDQNCFLDDAAAMEHARLAMTAPHLFMWQSVQIEQYPLNFAIPGDLGKVRVVGAWTRTDDGLEWTELASTSGNDGAARPLL